MEIKRTVYGVGYFGNGKYKSKVRGRATLAYTKWRDMLARCYCPKYQAKKPTYVGCTVDPIWHNYQNFAEWFEGNNFKDMGYHLDKDVLSKGNKIYSPENCCLVPPQINGLIIDSRAVRGAYPVGVKLDKRSGKFTSQVNINGAIKHLGTFESQQGAYKAYIQAKECYVKSKAIEWRNKIDERVFSALMNWRVVA